MALRFNPYPARQQQPERDVSKLVVNPLMQAIQLMMQQKQFGEQQEVQKQEMARREKEHRVMYGYDVPAGMAGVPGGTADQQRMSLLAPDQPSLYAKPGGPSSLVPPEPGTPFRHKGVAPGRSFLPDQFEKFRTAQGQPQIPPSRHVPGIKELESQYKLEGRDPYSQWLKLELQKESIKEKRAKTGYYGAREKQSEATAEYIPIKHEFKVEEDIELEIKQHTDLLAKTKVPSMLETFKQVDSLMGGVENYGAELPGFGPLEGKMANFMVTAKGRELRQFVQKILNINLKDRSGAAVTDSEYARYLREVGLGNKTPTERELRNAMAGYMRDVKAAVINLESGLAPSTMQEYRRRPQNINAADIPISLAQWAPRGGQGQPGGQPGGQPPGQAWDQSKESRYQELLRKRQSGTLR